MMITINLFASLSSSRHVKNLVPRSLLLFGLPGVGKKTLVKYLSARNNVQLVIVTPSLIIQEYSRVEDNCLAFFFKACTKKHTILLFDELDISFGTTPDSQTNNYQILRLFLLSLDKWQKERICEADLAQGFMPSLLIGCTRSLSNVESSVRRRFECEIEVPLPLPVDRYKILSHQKQLMLLMESNVTPITPATSTLTTTPKTPSTPPKPTEIMDNNTGLQSVTCCDLKSFALYACWGFSVTDVILLAQKTIAFLLSTSENHKVLTQSDLEDVKSTVLPTGLRNMIPVIPNISLHQIGGLDQVKVLILFFSPPPPPSLSLYHMLFYSTLSLSLTLTHSHSRTLTHSLTLSLC
eukprot:TRINITY_DN9182_c0_g1_i1.p1 TRINITY_DN9182_c0_g1~~TRINITY_DN9182_c0_g1_i1.p1  ORF type:complete len:352 (-),score=70.83 TRINITY_DN9182_c0_g1_i1:910-1965(-)